jgi:hypothetical protein
MAFSASRAPPLRASQPPTPSPSLTSASGSGWQRMRSSSAMTGSSASLATAWSGAGFWRGSAVVMVGEGGGDAAGRGQMRGGRRWRRRPLRPLSPGERGREATRDALALGGH